MNSKIIPKDLIPIADILKPKGLKGELKVFLYNNESEIFSNTTLYVSRANFDNAQDLHLVDLIGFIVKDEFGLEYGKINDIINLPTNDSLIFIYKDKEVMIPISDDFIKLFDFENRLVIVKNSDIFINKC